MTATRKAQQVPYGSHYVHHAAGYTTRYLTSLTEDSLGRVRLTHFCVSRDDDDHQVVVACKYILHRKVWESVDVTTIRRHLNGAFLCKWERSGYDTATIWVRQLQRDDSLAAVSAALDGYLAKRGYPSLADVRS
jgi:hypothetical protein